MIAMKKLIRYSILTALVLFVLGSCKKDFEDLKQNANLPGSVPPSLLLNGALTELYDRPYLDDHPLDERWCQYFLTNYDYYGNNRYDFGSGKSYYSTLKNVVKMEEEAVNLGLPEGNAYDAMAKFLKAYFFAKMTFEMGDIPMSEALQGLDNLTPVYDSQKDILLQVFTWLDEANSELATLISAGDATLSGDIYYGNDLTSWQRAVNALRIRLLIQLSKKVDDPDLQVSQQFAQIVGNPSEYPLFESASKHLQYNYLYPTNIYPNNPGSFGYDALRVNTSDTYVGLLTRLHDPRVFVTSEPAQALVDSVGPATSFDVFVGANPGEDLGSMYIKANSGYYSLLNRYHYYRTYTGEPTFILSFQEMCFSIAEGLNRGWATSGAMGSAEDYYIAGIRASMEFYDIPESGDMTVHFFKAGAGIGDADPYDEYTVTVDWDTYYNQTLVNYAGDNADGLTQILQQKYLSMFRHSGLEAYFTYRRTGVPEFETGPGTGNNGNIAMRFQYPANEKTTNPDNFAAALNAQGFGNNDDINGIIWLLK
jgi:hypothetical protein